MTTSPDPSTERAPASPLPSESPETSDPHEPTELRHTLLQFAEPNKRAARFALVANLVLVALIISSFARGSLPLLPILALIVTAASRWRIHTRGRDAVADRTGIRGPHLRHPIRWSEVAHLDEPLRYDPTIYVELADGSRKDTGFPPADFERLAALADVPIRPKSPWR